MHNVINNLIVSLDIIFLLLNYIFNRIEYYTLFSLSIPQALH